MKLVLSVYPISPPLTGIGRYTWELATRLPGFSDIECIRYFSLGRWIPDLQELLNKQQSSTKLRSVLTSSGLATRLYELVSPLLYRAQFASLGDYIYHSPNFFLPPFPGKSIATFHDLSAFRHPEFHLPTSVGLLRREIPRALERADHLIVVSEFTRREIVELLDFPADRISVVPNGVSAEFYPRDDDALEVLLAKYDLKPGKYFLSVATLEPRKNIDSILDAHEMLPAAVRRIFPLVICGDDGWKSEQLHLRIQSLVDQGFVRRIGYIAHNELPLLYSGARALVYVPFYEGFGLPALEAMGSGVPVIVSDSSSLPEVVGQSGYLVNALDVDAIASRMEEVLVQSPELSEKVSAGLIRAKQLTWENCAASTVQVYRQVMQAG